MILRVSVLHFSPTVVNIINSSNGAVVQLTSDQFNFMKHYGSSLLCPTEAESGFTKRSLSSRLGLCSVYLAIENILLQKTNKSQFFAHVRCISQEELEYICVLYYGHDQNTLVSGYTSNVKLSAILK